MRSRFNEIQNDYEVVLLAVPYDAFASKLTSAIPRGNGPDAFIFAHERVGDWAESGIISDVSDILTEKETSALIPSTVDAMRYGGKLWGIPLSFKSAVLFYRADKVTKVPENTDELLKAAEKFTDTEHGKYGLAFEAASAYFAAPFIYGFGGKFLVSHDSAKLRAVVGRHSVTSLSVYDDPEIASDEILNVFRKQADISVPMSNNPKMRMVWEPLAGALRKVLRGAEDPKNALDNAQKQFRIFSKPVPKAQSPVVFVIILAAAGIIGLFIAVRQIKKHKFVEKLFSSPTPYIYLFPAMFSMLLLVFVPFAVGTAVAFFAHKSGEYEFVGFANFISILLSSDFPITDPLSFWFTLAVTVLWTAVNVFLHVSIGLVLALMLREPWLKMKGLYRMLLIIPWAVPRELEDAASVDGANGFQRFRHVIFPLLKPALLPAVILGSVWTSICST